MAQQVVIAGAMFSDVPSISVPDSNGVYHGFTDVSDTTADAGDVASGKYFYSSAGVRTVGTALGGATYSTVEAQIATSAWSGTTATVNVTGVTASNDVIVAPAPASTTAWASAGIYCSAQGAGTLTFTCSTAPSAAVTANVMVWTQ